MRRNRGYRMKAIVIREFGGPEVLRWEDVPTPKPGPDEVLVRVHAVSVNLTLDLQVRQDGGSYGTVLPLVLGNDPSGVVVAAGQGVEQPLLNQRRRGLWWNSLWGVRTLSDGARHAIQPTADAGRPMLGRPRRISAPPREELPSHS
jgi:NADPH:quinone reductase-like Zn-dependent oxidoreductase